MFDKLRNLLTNTTASSSPQDGLNREGDTHKTHVAIAALLIEAARADDDYTAVEASYIAMILSKKFKLSDEQTQALMAEADATQLNATDLYQFSRVVKDTLSHEEKCTLLEELWSVILADNTRDPFEDALMRRLGGLIYVSDTEIGSARQRALSQPKET